MKKIVLGVLVVLGLWWALQVPRIANLLFQFLALGVNPFTGKDIDPTTMAQFSGGLLVLSIVILFGGNFVRFWRRMRDGRRQVVAPQEQAALVVDLPVAHETFAPAPIAAPAPVAAITAQPTLVSPLRDMVYATKLEPLHFDPTTKQALPLAPLPALVSHVYDSGPIHVQVARKPKKTKTPREPRHLSLPRVRLPHISLHIPLRRWSDAVVFRLRTTAAAGAVELDSAWRRLLAGARRTQVTIGVLVLVFWHSVLQGWRWLHPRLEQFDRWLERQVRKKRASAKTLRALSELEKTIKTLPDAARAFWKQIAN